MTYLKHTFRAQAQKKARIAKNGNRSFTLVETDHKGKTTYCMTYGNPEKVIEEHRKLLLERLLRIRKRRQEHPIAGWIDAVAKKQTRLGYDDWVNSVRRGDALEDVMEMLNG